MWTEKAVEKLNSEVKNVNGQKEGAMKNAVKDALLDFCKQDEEFAQAIVQGGSFADCMKEVAKGVGGHISDLEAYRKAVSFYFPGAEIKCVMTIDLIGAAGRNDVDPLDMKSGIMLNLADFL